MDYTQPPNLTESEIDSFLEKAPIARICTLNKDGTIHAAPVWFRYRHGKIVFGTPTRSRKARNLRRDDRITALIDVEGPPTRGVIVYGRAEMKMSGLEQAVWIFSKYMKPERAATYAKGLLGISKWVQVDIVPDHMGSFDYAKDRTYFDAVDGGEAEDT
jgi:nitroimidazol reductase NimA-like FMN-containing flavoprotein (pyridoxamine 5'-phosphate oxidase superfamily)